MVNNQMNMKLENDVDIHFLIRGFLCGSEVLGVYGIRVFRLWPWGLSFGGGAGGGGGVLGV